MYSISLFILFMCAANGFARKCTEASSLKGRNFEYKENILLINNTSTYKDNEYFKRFSHDVEVLNEICPGGVQGLITATKLFPNCFIINLNVNDFFNFNYNYVSRYLIYGGDRHHKPQKVRACNINKLDSQSMTCNHNAIQYFSYPAVKLMSANIENYLELYNAVNDFTGQRYVERHQEMRKHFILICVDEYIEDFEYNGIVIKFSLNCEKEVEMNTKYLIGVVTRKPLEMDYDIIVPIILYEAQCYEDNISKIHNYIEMASCDHYKYAFVEFLKSLDWTRVALISDNTPYSEKFEREVGALFGWNQFAYTVVKCRETGSGSCNFIEALESLKKSDGRVFFANVDENNAKMLEKAAHKVWTQENSLLSWIFRGLVFRGGIEVPGHMYSLILEPQINESTNRILEFSIPSNIQYRVSFIAAIKKIAHAYGTIKIKYKDENRKHFFRKLTNKIRKHLSHDAKANVYWKGESEPYTTMTIQNNSVKIQYKRQRRLEDMTSCIIRRADFCNPCDDYILLYILIVLVAVATSGLVAAICYNRFDSNTRQYTNLE